MTSTAALLLRADQIRPRTQQVGIGMSDLGSCRKRTGFKLAGTKPVNAAGSVQAIIGSAIHDLLARHLAEHAEEGDLTEYPVNFAGIPGTLDRYEAATRCVVDVKSTSSRWLEHIKLHGADHDHLWQTSGYAAALALEGIPVERIRIDYLCRDTGEEYQWPSADGMPFSTQPVREAIEWLKLVRSTPLEMLPRDEEPESVWCQGCPFGGADGGICWQGHVGQRDMRSVLYLEDPDAAKWAEQLWQARQDAKAAKALEREAKGALDAIRPEEGSDVVACGDRYLRWSDAGLRFVAKPKDPA